MRISAYIVMLSVQPVNSIPAQQRNTRERRLIRPGIRRLGPGGLAMRMGVEEQDSYVRQFTSFFISSVRLSLVTRSVST
jgi:hypothetical protein